MRKTAGFLLVLLLAALVVITTSSGDETDSSHVVHLTGGAAYGPQISVCDDCHPAPAFTDLRPRIAGRIFDDFADPSLTLDTPSLRGVGGSGPFSQMRFGSNGFVTNASRSPSSSRSPNATSELGELVSIRNGFRTAEAFCDLLGDSQAIASQLWFWEPSPAAGLLLSAITTSR